MKLIGWICGALITIAAVAFAVFNRAPVAVVLNPFAPAYEISTYILVLAPLALGFMAGGLVMWLESFNLRLERRRQKRRIKTLEGTLQAVNENPAAPPSDFFPSVPAKDLQRVAADS